MPGNGVEVPLQARLAHTRRRLATAFSFDEAFVAISRAGPDVLRELEADYTFLPGPARSLRERIALTHERLVRVKVQMSTQRVTPLAVTAWAQETLGLFMTGVTDFDATLGGQYRIQPVAAPAGPGSAATFEVTTMQGHDPRRFLVAVGVTEETS